MSKAEPVPERPTSLTDLARLGFSALERADASLVRLGRPDVIPWFAEAADPDAALERLLRLAERDAAAVERVLGHPEAAGHLIRLLGASEGLSAFFHRRPDELASLIPAIVAPSPAEAYRTDLLAAIGDLGGRAGPGRDAGAVSAASRPDRRLGPRAAERAGRHRARRRRALRPRRRGPRGLARGRATRRTVRGRDQIAATRLAIFGMGKSGGRRAQLPERRRRDLRRRGCGRPRRAAAVEIGTRLAMLTMRGVSELAVVPGLWDVDANLRPEGKDGALVRTLESHVAYYDRWAHDWEFLALLKARPLAGDRELGRALRRGALPARVAERGPLEVRRVGCSACRGRITEHIPAEQVDVQLKLGPGGLRDFEFTVQLLQLVHGLNDEHVRVTGTLPALLRLVDNGYIGRVEAAEFAEELPVPAAARAPAAAAAAPPDAHHAVDDDGLRVLARATGLAATRRRAARALAGRSRCASARCTSGCSTGRCSPRSRRSRTATSRSRASRRRRASRRSASGTRRAHSRTSRRSPLGSPAGRRSSGRSCPCCCSGFSEGGDPDGGLPRVPPDLRRARRGVLVPPAAPRLVERRRAPHAGTQRVEVRPGALRADPGGRGVARERGRPAAENARLAPRGAGVDHDPAPRRRDRRPRRALHHLRRREMLGSRSARSWGSSRSTSSRPPSPTVVTTVLAGALALAHRLRRRHRVRQSSRWAATAGGNSGWAQTRTSCTSTGTWAPGMRRRRRPSGSSTSSPASPRTSWCRSTSTSGCGPRGKNGAIVRSVESYRAYYERWSVLLGGAGPAPGARRRSEMWGRARRVHGPDRRGPLPGRGERA